MVRRRSRCALLAVALGCAGVGGCGSTEPNDGPGLRVIAGAGLTDSASAVLKGPLVIQLLDSVGTPMPGEEIHFEGRNCQGFFFCSPFIAKEGSDAFQQFLIDSTDNQGRLAVRVMLGFTAGEGRIRIEATRTGQVTTALYTIAPASLAMVQAFPADSTAFAGETYQLRGVTSDAYGNPRSSDDITYALLDGPATVTAEGLARGTGVGRVRIVARSGSVRDTVFMSVVPAGTLAVTFRADATEVRTVRLDGSAMRTVAASGRFEGGVPAWSPSGELLAFQQGGSGEPVVIMLSDLNTAPHRLAPTSTATDERYPRFSRDGVWVYFRASDPSVPDGEIRRVHPDGTALEGVGAAKAGDIQLDPSPDGTRIAVTNVGQAGPALVVRTLESGAETPLGVAGSLPRWSPDGTWIAYWQAPPSGLLGTIRLVRPDGSEDHAVSTPEHFSSAGLDWSPDGRWLIARAEAALELIEVSTGLTLPLAFATNLDWPVWKPE
jgi:Tol biopolymer transport system component